MSIKKIVYENLYGLGDLANANVSSLRSTDSLYNGPTVVTPIRSELENLAQQEYSRIRSLPENQFQSETKKRFKEKLDTFLSIPPSRGKTDPIIGGFRYLLKKYLLKKLNYTPILLYVVPRKQLAGQINTKDVNDEIILKLIKPLTSRAVNPWDLSDRDEINELLDTSHLFTSYFIGIRGIDQYQRKVREITAEFTAELVGSGDKDINYSGKFDFSIKPIIIATYENAKNVPFNNISHIVIDELQELVPHPNETSVTPDLLSRYDSLTSILRNASRNSSITLMTGSINDNSVKALCKYFNDKYKRNFVVVPEYYSTRPQLNRSSLVLIPLQELANFEKRVKICKDIVINNQFNSIMILFSIKPTGEGIFRIMEMLCNALPQRMDGSLTLKENMLVTPSMTELEYLKYFDPVDIIQKRDNTVTIPNTNNLLYKSLHCGFGCLLGQMDQHHKKTVQKLFIENQIYLLLATDAIGIGANVKCKYLYLPSAKKFDGTRISNIDESSLVQIIHRAGRDVSNIPVATIYCTIEDFEYLNKLIYTDPRSGVPEINPYLLRNLKELEDEHGPSFLEKVIRLIWK